MKVVLVANAGSIHTIQWAKHLKNRGVDVEVISQHSQTESFPKDIPIHVLPLKGNIGYFFNAPILRRLLKKIKPDIVNAHYASGYGTTIRLANFHPYVISVWGSDVYEFPCRSLIHRNLLKKNLNSADAIASTSAHMAEQTKLYVHKNKPIHITPFGVDLNRFKHSLTQTPEVSDTIIIGTVKTLKHIYGIDIFIKALSIMYKNVLKKDTKLAKKLHFRIVGGGPDLSELRNLAYEYGIGAITTFVGEVSHDEVPFELQNFDIYVALSRQESFGVAVIEAQAMSLPVVVSNVGGLPEVVNNYQTGFIVESENVEQAASMIEKMVSDNALRSTMAGQARYFVESNFSWDACVERMINVYYDTLEKNS